MRTGSTSWSLTPPVSGPNDMFTTEAGAPAGSPFESYGSRAHCMPAMIWGVVPLPPGSTSPCMSRAPGATPMWTPLASPPTTVPLTWVPWVWVSRGWLATGRPAASHSIQPPGKVGSVGSSVAIRPARSGWVTATPVSSTATRTPEPSTPSSSHTRWAPIRSMPQVRSSTVATVPASAGSASGRRSVATGSIAATAGSAVRSWRVCGSERTSSRLASQNELRISAPCACRCATTGRWLRAATRLSSATTASRSNRIGARSARSARTTR